MHTTEEAEPSLPHISRAETKTAAMPMMRAQVIAIALFVPIVAISLLPHVYLWGVPDGNPFPLSLIAALLGSIVVHEGLHGLGYYWSGASRANIEFGFNWSGLAPYAHCSAPLRATPYRVAIALPGLVLGVPPLLAGLGLGSWWLTLYAFLMLAAAGGDALLLWTLRKVPGNAWTQDHPTQMGCLVLGHASSPVPPVLEPATENNLSAEKEDASASEADLSRRTLLIILIVVTLLGIGVGYFAAPYL